MRRLSSAFAAGFITIFLFSANAGASISEGVRQRIEVTQYGFALEAAGKPLLAKTAIATFYEQNGFEPIWVRGDKVRGPAKQFVQLIEESSAHGLTPADYHLDTIQRLIGTREARARETDLTDLELLLTDAYLLLGSHLSAGKLNPETIDAEWFANRRDVDMVTVLTDAVTDRALARRLQELSPQDANYTALLARLAEYRAIDNDGGFARIAEGPALKPDLADERISQLRRRLRQSGDLTEAPTKDDPLVDATYDVKLANAVKAFQSRHGLTPDGVVGGATLTALNRPVSERIDQVRVNLERLRWAPEDLGRRHVVVNIAGFELRAVEDNKTVFAKRVIVGRDYRRTPVFSDQISYLVLNPTWTVPQSIAVADKLPDLRSDPAKLVNAGYDVYQGSGADQRKVDPMTVNWANVTPQTFSYRMVQRAGPQNALGQVKFMFPNQFNVYLHDTPSRELFAQERRSFSSGCVRVQEPLDLAAFALKGQGDWTPAKLSEAVASKNTQTVTLDRPLPIHITYLTAWSDEDGALQFRDDIYARDTAVLAGLRTAPL